MLTNPQNASRTLDLGCLGSKDLGLVLMAQSSTDLLTVGQNLAEERRQENNESIMSV